MPRTPFVAGNWKMNLTVEAGLDLVDEMIESLEAFQEVEIVLCPPFVSLYAISEELIDTEIGLGAQNMHEADKGAYTGEVSPVMLADLCDYVILGHSERRQYFGETDEWVNRKVKAAYKHDLVPIICVGETAAQRDAGQTNQVVIGQTTQVLAGLTTEQVRDAVIAYEPVWAIGTGRTPTSDDANQVIGTIRRTVAQMFGAQAAEAIRILYGGSVTAANAGDFFRQPEIDGALVGGASLKAQEFIAICRAAQEAKK